MAAYRLVSADSRRPIAQGTLDTEKNLPDVNIKGFHTRSRLIVYLALDRSKPTKQTKNGTL